MTGFNAFYFSFITLSTVGYGDITPALKNCALACSHGSDDRAALCYSPDRPVGRTLPERRRKIPCREFNAKIR